MDKCTLSTTNISSCGRLASLRDVLPTSSDNVAFLDAKYVSKVDRRSLWRNLQSDGGPKVFWGLKNAGGSRRHIVDPAVRADTENIVWLEFLAKDKVGVKALLMEGVFTACCGNTFAPRKQTWGCYGRKVADTLDSVDSPMAVWMRHHFNSSGELASTGQIFRASNAWSRALLETSIAAIECANEFLSLPVEKQILVSTFLTDGMTKVEAMEAASYVTDLN